MVDFTTEAVCRRALIFCNYVGYLADETQEFIFRLCGRETRHRLKGCALAVALPP